jgi:uncharacterized membrane protein
MSVEINTSEHGRLRYRRPSAKSPARQRGAIGILGATVLLLSVLFTALAVDTGRLMLEQRRLQKIADMAALDGARALACGGGTGSVKPAVDRSAEFNNHTGDILDVEFGDVQPQDGIRVFGVPKEPGFPNAIRVTAGDTRVPASLVAGGWLGNTVNLQAAAVAGAPTMEQVVGTLSVGSYLARLDTSEAIYGPLLQGLLGTDVELDLVSYKGLADAKVTLLDLIEAHAKVGTVNELLDLDISMQEFMLLTAKALSNAPNAPTAAVELLDTISAQVDASLHLRLRDLLYLDQELLELDTPVDQLDQQAALRAKLNVLDLISLAAEVANKNHAVEVALPVNIPGIATANLTTYIIEPPQIAIGPAGHGADGEWVTRAHTAQVNAQLNLSLLNGLGVPGAGAVNLDLVVTGADARAGFESFNCAKNGRNAVVGHVVQAARIAVGRFDDISKSKPEIEPSEVVKLPGLVSITAYADLELGESAESSGELTFESPFPNTQKTDNNALGASVSTLLSGLASKLELGFGSELGPALNLVLMPILNLLGLGSSQGLLDLVAGLLTPVLQALDPLLSGLLDALGISLAGADISVLDVEDGEEGDAVRPRLLI